MRALSLFLILFLASPAFARGPGWVLSMPSFVDDGDSRVPFKVEVGSTQPVELYIPDILKDRAMVVFNPSVTYDLMVGTSSDFNIIDNYWLVFKNSGTFVSSNHSPLYGKYQAGAGSETVRGMVEKQ